jgi:hypothetical protein
VRERERGRQGISSPPGGNGGGEHLPAGIDDGRSAIELFSSVGGRRWGEELGRASLGRYLLRRAADKRERREDLGQIRPGEKEMEFFLHSFLFSVFRTFALF